jgi:hypothetical protein
LKDLKVLEEQQIQAAKQLQKAREKKAEIEQKSKDIEFQLGELKYQDGQMRAETERIQEMLQVALQKFNTTKDETDKANQDLRKFMK